MAALGSDRRFFRTTCQLSAMSYELALATSGTPLPHFLRKFQKKLWLERVLLVYTTRLLFVMAALGVFADQMSAVGYELSACFWLRPVPPSPCFA
jgi:hypothetical protein